MNDKSSSQFSKYRILGLVGRGQFGKVLCARLRDTGTLVALKELENKRFPTSKLLRELRFLLTLQHENIVSCSALMHHRNYRYLVMDYCEGGTLRDLMNYSKTLPLRQCFDLINDILLGLEHAHAANIIHCDIKPENVLLKITAQGWQAKISDFGIARLSQEIDADSNNTGSPGYMAPERFYGQFSISSDLYAVGVILYELLVGKRPFSGMPTELMNAHLNSRVSIPDSLPQSLQSIITRSLEKLPKRRYKSAQEMRLDLVQALQTFDIDKLTIPSSADSCPTNFFVNKAQFFASQSSEYQINSIAAGDKSRFYTASNQFIHWHNFTLDQSEQLIRAETKIASIAYVKKSLFIATNRHIYQFIQGKPKIIYKFPTPQNFDLEPLKLTISPEADWMAVAISKHLEIHNLQYGRAMRLEFATRPFNTVIAYDRHHLVAITNKPNTQESRAIVISRRCNVLYRLALPIRVAHGIATYTSDRVLLLEETNRKNVYILDIKPYRLIRIPLNYEVLLMVATPWGYALSAKYVDNYDLELNNESPTEQTILILLDLRGNNIHNLIIDGKVTAIAPIDTHLLAININHQQVNQKAIDQPANPKPTSNNKIYIVNLKKLEIDLIL
ncbi:MAG: serine/threonine-protein kinase [Pseudanabaenaceae cyanobacterium bins.39]|nr:serine/threonine-protein kinase [Pseudanabaenaceae cyanobacterium bins.39]